MPKKRLLLYIPLADGAGSRLAAAVGAVVPKEATELAHAPEGLARRPRRPNNGLEAAVLMAVSRRELEKLLALSQILEELRIILILPDADPQTIAQGHSLRPRYLTNIHSDFQDVAAVLGKMLAGPETRTLAHES